MVLQQNEWISLESLDEAGVHCKVLILDEDRLSRLKSLGCGHQYKQHLVVEQKLLLRHGTNKQTRRQEVGVTKASNGRKGMKSFSSVSDLNSAFSPFS